MKKLNSTAVALERASMVSALSLMWQGLPQLTGASPYGLAKVTGKRMQEQDGPYKGLYRSEIYKDGKLFALYPANQKQPRRDKKTIVINSFTYSINWQ